MNNQDLVELIDKLKSLVISHDHLNGEVVDYITAVVQDVIDGLTSINQDFLTLTERSRSNE